MRGTKPHEKECGSAGDRVVAVLYSSIGGSNNNDDDDDDDDDILNFVDSRLSLEFGEERVSKIRILTLQGGGRMEMNRKLRRKGLENESSATGARNHINDLDDGCLMHIFSFLSPIPDRYNTALVCRRWCHLACHPRLWLRVDRSVKESSEDGVFHDIQTAVVAARPGDTILIASGESHTASNIQIKKPLCLVGGGTHPDDTSLVCSRGADSVLEFQSNCKVANLSVKAELGCCLLHRSGRLTIDGCVLQCESNPLDFLSFPIISTATGQKVLTYTTKEQEHRNIGQGNSVTVSHTRIEGGAKAVSTSGDLALQRVRVIYARTSLLFWFDVDRD